MMEYAPMAIGFPDIYFEAFTGKSYLWRLFCLYRYRQEQEPGVKP
jgi:hypothetical protein